MKIPRKLCAMVEIETGHCVNTRQNWYHLSQLAGLDIRGLYFCYDCYSHSLITRHCAIAVHRSVIVDLLLML